VCAAGRHQFTMCNLALLMGGNTRVGLEPARIGHTGGSQEGAKFKGVGETIL